MMDRMDSSDWLRSDLGDGGLRRMIFEIDKADLETSRSALLISNIMRRRPPSPSSDLNQSD